MRELVHYNDQLDRVLPQVLRLQYKITGAAAASPIVSNTASLITFGAWSAQSTIDNFLGTTNEFLLAAFDATAMGADVVGGIVNMGGQAQSVVKMVASCWSDTGGATKVERCVQASSALTASTLATEVACGANGNIAFRAVFGNTPDFDALTSGTIEIEIHWIPK